MGPRAEACGNRRHVGRHSWVDGIVGCRFPGFLHRGFWPTPLRRKAPSPARSPTTLAPCCQARPSRRRARRSSRAAATVVTDGEGRYTIVDLRPGAYTVTFSLEGFSRSDSRGHQLPSNFTATVDATLSVGRAPETRDRQRRSPIVDVQQAQRSQVLDAELLESVVNSGSLWVQANLVAGVRMSGTDVGGSQYSRTCRWSRTAPARSTTPT